MTSSVPLADELKNLLGQARALKKALDRENTQHVSKTALRAQARACASKWSGGLARRTRAVSGISPETASLYDGNFKQLLKLSSDVNRRASYLSVLDSISKRFRKDLINPAIGAEDLGPPTAWDEFLEQLPATTESEYFREAIDCAKAGFLRAATVLGWCACVDHIHRKAAVLGFPRFNQASVEMAAQATGRFKRFNKKFSVNSLSELRGTVFDDDLLLVTEYLGIIDVNEFRRLRACFDMRNQAGHPGDAPITEYNLMSFFSDVLTIVLRNPRFAIEHSDPTPGE